jgi:hypothetical protein
MANQYNIPGLTSAMIAIAEQEGIDLNNCKWHELQYVVSRAELEERHPGTSSNSFTTTFPINSGNEKNKNNTSKRNRVI